MTPDRERLTTGGVARLFGVDSRTVTRWARQEKIPAHRMPSGRLTFFADEIRPLVPGASAEPTQVSA